MNFIYGPFSRVKLPAPVPLLGLMAVFIAGYKVKPAALFIVAQLALTVLVFTPSLAMPQVDLIETADLLDKCVANDAKMYLDDDYSRQGLIQIPLFRQNGEHYWFGQYIAIEAGVAYQSPQLNDPLAVGGSIIERDDWQCSEQVLEYYQQRAANVLMPNSLWLETRKAIRGEAPFLTR